ncbi:hypothetical protein CXG81DRAFT_26984 [Caulochytrium protostelioides]|nr:hypothetical protein CXG81DRAFT_26984 [Caulochytrium protostelioides]|eukprot:RKP00295.1 hypothetical protein CXG81DRAFT_26984 [Caulochytrium protostelioides]
MTPTPPAPSRPALGFEAELRKQQAAHDARRRQGITVRRRDADRDDADPTRRPPLKSRTGGLAAVLQDRVLSRAPQAPHHDKARRLPTDAPPGRRPAAARPSSSSPSSLSVPERTEEEAERERMARLTAKAALYDAKAAAAAADASRLGSRASRPASDALVDACLVDFAAKRRCLTAVASHRDADERVHIIDDLGRDRMVRRVELADLPYRFRYADDPVPPSSDSDTDSDSDADSDSDTASSETNQAKVEAGQHPVHDSAGQARGTSLSPLGAVLTPETASVQRSRAIGRFEAGYRQVQQRNRQNSHASTIERGRGPVPNSDPPSS